MSGTGHEGELSGEQQRSSRCDRCQQPARLVFSQARPNVGQWLCGKCMAELDALTAGSAVPTRQPAPDREGPPPGPGLAVGCAIALCLVIIWAALVLAALLHGR